MLSEPSNVINPYWGSKEELSGRCRFIVRDTCVQLFLPVRDKHRILPKMQSTTGVWLTFGTTLLHGLRLRLVRLRFENRRESCWYMQSFDIEGFESSVREGMRLYVWDDLGCQYRLYIADVEHVGFLAYLDESEVRNSQLFD